MSDLIIYGHVLSQIASSVMVFCRLSLISYIHKDLNIFLKEKISDKFLRINSFQEMPAIVHEDYNLLESAAIVAYLADTFNIDNQWYPKDNKIRGRINAYLHWHHQGTREPISGYLMAKVSGPRFFRAP